LVNACFVTQRQAPQKLTLPASRTREIFEHLMLAFDHAHFNIPKKRRAETAMASFERPPNCGCSWEVSRNSRVTPDADADRWAALARRRQKENCALGLDAAASTFLDFVFGKTQSVLSCFPVGQKTSRSAILASSNYLKLL